MIINIVITDTKIYFTKINSINYYHRQNGPAIIRATDTKHWFQNNLRHREDGPATEWFDGEKEYWLNGCEISKKFK